jgi:hypothetical protein
MEDVYTYAINGKIESERGEIELSINLDAGIVCYTNIRQMFLNAMHHKKTLTDEFKFYKLSSNNIRPINNLSYKKICDNPSNVEEIINHYDQKSSYKLVNNLKYNSNSPIMYIAEKYNSNKRIIKRFYWLRGNFVI